MILEKFLSDLRDILTGSNIPDTEVTVKATVKLPDENRIVNLKIIGITSAINEITPAKRKRISTMYPPTHEAVVSIECITEK